MDKKLNGKNEKDLMHKIPNGQKTLWTQNVMDGRPNGQKI